MGGGALSALKNGRHEKFARGVVEGLSADAAYAAAGYKPDRGHAARLAANGSVRERIAELQREAAAASVLSARWVIEELEKNYHRAVVKGDLSNANRSLELIGRHFRAWNPGDGADATQDHIPLAERLKFYQREAATGDAGDKVVCLNLEERLRGRVK